MINRTSRLPEPEDHVRPIVPAPLIAYEAQIAASCVALALTDDDAIWLAAQMLGLLTTREAARVADVLAALEKRGQYEAAEVVAYVTQTVAPTTQPLGENI